MYLKTHVYNCICLRCPVIVWIVGYHTRFPLSKISPPKWMCFFTGDLKFEQKKQINPTSWSSFKHESPTINPTIHPLTPRFRFTPRLLETLNLIQCWMGFGQKKTQISWKCSGIKMKRSKRMQKSQNASRFWSLEVFVCCVLNHVMWCVCVCVFNLGSLWASLSCGWRIQWNLIL